MGCLRQYLEKKLSTSYQLQRDCCLDGMRNTPLSYTCEMRAEYINDGALCAAAFLHCCKEMETQRAERKEDSLILARSKTQGQGMGGEALGGYLVILVIRRQSKP
uniref:Anaphylatoxin-like domain-containing protein n=1 Tax=Sander lucioperca TaxID=283035 RepID=A0A8C9XUQ9_SANLU